MDTKSIPVSKEEWEKGYDDIKNRYVNYLYHDEVCKVSLERYAKIDRLEAENKRLRRWIEENTSHTDDCWEKIRDGNADCICGRDELLTPKEVK